MMVAWTSCKQFAVCRPGTRSQLLGDDGYQGTIMVNGEHDANNLSLTSDFIRRISLYFLLYFCYQMFVALKPKNVTDFGRAPCGYPAQVLRFEYNPDHRQS
jgi:hypothetical protein